MLTQGQRALLKHMTRGRVLGPAPRWNDGSFEFRQFRCDGDECAELFSRRLLKAVPAAIDDPVLAAAAAGPTPSLSHEWLLTEAGAALAR